MKGLNFERNKDDFVKNDNRRNSGAKDEIRRDFGIKENGKKKTKGMVEKINI